MYHIVNTLGVRPALKLDTASLTLRPGNELVVASPQGIPGMPAEPINMTASGFTIVPGENGDPWHNPQEFLVTTASGQIVRDWSPELVVTGLAPNTAYLIYARHPASNGYAPSPIAGF